MAEYIAEVQSGGLLEIPSDLLAQLGLQDGDRVLLTSHEAKIVLEKLPMSAFKRGQAFELPKNRPIH